MYIRSIIWVLVPVCWLNVGHIVAAEAPVKAVTPVAKPGQTGNKFLPIPVGPLTGTQIAEHAHYVGNGGLIDNAVSRRHKRDIALLVNRAPLDKRGPGRKPSVNTFETFVNNNAEDPEIDGQRMAIMMSGKVKGTGVLFTSYTDKNRSGSIALWLPALRKIRRLNEPSHEDNWVGSNFTYGELALRRPEHEQHELLGEAIFNDCLLTMELDRAEMTRLTRNLPRSQCEHRGKPVFRLKSTTRFSDWWYDYRISDIDKQTFSTYRTVYYKDDKKIKTVTIDWQSLNMPDPRINYPRYIYAITHETGVDSLVYVPRSTIELNTDLPDSFWSEDTLKKQGRP